MQRISPSFITFVSMKSDKRVLLGMSGGTDSSLAALGVAGNRIVPGPP